MIQIKDTLYALNKDGSFQEWKVFVDGGVIHVNYGKLGGKIQSKLTTCEPKNVGRANETTAEEQAIAEATSKWDKQYRLGYRQTTEELTTEERFSPMLAADAIKKSHMIVYPCYVQPKLDGLRCLVTFDSEGNPEFNSRGNKLYPIQGLIPQQLKVLQEKTGYPMFDGEVYIHGLSLQKIGALTKKWRTHETIKVEIDKDFAGEHKRRDKAILDGKKEYKTTDGDMVSVSVIPERDDNRYGGYESADLQFHIFDIPDKDKVWYDPETKEGRLTDLIDIDVEITAFFDLSHLKVVHGEFKETEQEVKDSIALYMLDSYEGSMVRNFKGRYEFCQRSTDLIKWKIFQNAEAKVIGSREDKNGEGVLECIEQDGTIFGCKMKGTFSERRQSAALRLVGKFITFSFQARTEDGVPQFAVGQYVRDVNPDTWEVNE